MIRSKNTLTNILFYLSIGLLMISIHQSASYGFTRSYFIYMFAFSVFLWYSYRRTQEKRALDKSTPTLPVEKRPKPSEAIRKGAKKSSK